MKALSFLCGTICAVCSVSLSLLAMYVEWLFIRDNFIQLLNPLLQVQVLIAMVTLPATWFLVIGAVISYFATIGMSSGK